MDFNKLYTLLIEADEQEIPLAPAPEGERNPEGEVANTDNNGVAVPDNYDVEPAPMAPTVNHGESVQSIKGYIDKITSFADELNNVDGGSLSEYLNKIDLSGSAFEGISNLKKKIISAAVDLRSVVEDLKGFAISQQKNISNPAPPTR